MKYLKVLVLLIGLAFSTSVLAQEKEAERPKEKPAEKEAEKPKEKSAEKEAEKPKANNPHGFIFQIWAPGRGNRGKVSTSPITFADVTGVELVFDKIADDESNDENLCLPTPPGIVIITKATNPNSNLLVYNYTVSGGRIIGQGEKVVWDLSGLKPGTYTITAAVDDGCGFCGKTQTKTITVKQ